MNVRLEFLALDSHSNCLENRLFQLDRWCSVSHENWMKPKKSCPLYDCSLLIWRISSVNQSEVCPTITYQHQHISSVLLSSHTPVPLNKSMIFFLNKAELTSLVSILIIARLSSLCEEQWDHWLTNIFSHSSSPLPSLILAFHILGT